MDNKRPTGRQIAAARTLAGLTQPDLAGRANISVPTLKRMEASEGPALGMTNNVAAVCAALEAAGVEFTNSDQPGIKLKADRTYGYVYDDQRLVGLIKDGEFRSDSPNRELIALVKNSSLHDPETGERICGLKELGTKGTPLPERLRARII